MTSLVCDSSEKGGKWILEAVEAADEEKVPYVNRPKDQDRCQAVQQMK